MVGKPSTPTPRGAFFIEEALALSSEEAGGPFALATSARSNVFQEFEGGPGQIGIHGTDNLTGALGTRGLARLHPARRPRDHLAGETHRRRGATDDHAMSGSVFRERRYSARPLTAASRRR